MTTATLTLADCLRLLADAEVHVSSTLCAIRAFHGQYDAEGQVCPECGFGYRRIPRFRDAEGKALFRKRCPRSYVLVNYEFLNDPLHDGKCCKGEGWVTLPEAEATIDRMLDATRSQKWRVYLDSWQNDITVVGIYDDRFIVQLSRVEDTGARLACYRALVAAVQREEGQP